MRIATVGKGGSGKTTIAGTLARIFAAEGRRILAIDGDPNPNLALMLGMAPGAANKLGFIPTSVIKKVEKGDGTATLELALPQDELLQKYAQAAASNVEAGKDVFKKCAACHTPNKGGENKVGPNLFGVIGRKLGSHAGFAYSDAVKNKGGDWTYETMAAYLHNPKDSIPGNKMAFAGVPDTQDLVDVIAYLRTLDDSPKPLPN